MNDDKIHNIGSNYKELEDGGAGILGDIKSGELQGISYAASYSDGTVNVAYLGCHAKNPVFALGATMILVNSLSRKATD